MAYKRAVVVLIGKETARAAPGSSTRSRRRGRSGNHSSGSGFMACRRWGQSDSIGGDPFANAGLRGVPIYDPGELASIGKGASLLRLPTEPSPPTSSSGFRRA